MASDLKSSGIKPRIIIHGGAGNVSRETLRPEQYTVYKKALIEIVHHAHKRLTSPGAIALDVATYAVTRLEDNPLFNAGRGAVYTRTGTHELEASVMVSKGLRKRGVGVMAVTRAKNPILLAKEMLLRGQEDNGGGAQQHCQLAGETCDKLAERWNLPLVAPSYFWTRRRWDEHRKALGKSHDDDTYKKHRQEADEDCVDSVRDEMTSLEDTEDIVEGIWTGNDNWNGHDYLPQGTVGCVVLDNTGTLAVATSTGGLTNKLPGRIGDTPTLGAGFWAEEWQSEQIVPNEIVRQQLSLPSLLALVSDCIPGLSEYMSLPRQQVSDIEPRSTRSVRAAAMSGTGNGDSFLRLAAVRTASAIVRFSSSSISLQDAVTAVAGPNGMLQQSAEDRWQKTGEGEGGIIGIEVFHGKGRVVAAFNCGGMFRAWVDDEGRERMAVFREEV